MKVMRTKKKKLRWWKIPLGIIAALLAIVIIYVAYVFISYNRIEDNRPVEPVGGASAATVQLDKEYTALSYNVGFGAYTPDFTFFMDGGTSSWAASKESVIDCINGAASVVNDHKADFALYQEVDTDSTRSYHVDESVLLREAMPDYSSTFAVNYHSAFLFYPLLQPHGASNSGLLTLSDAEITSALRRSLPISEGVSKIVDLDRCYCINHIPTEDDKELVIFNVHLSAYGTDGDLQDRQLGMLFDDMQKEYEAGNYVVCGGDFNHDFTCTSKAAFNESYGEYTWAADFPDELIPEHFSKATDYQSGMTVPSTRNCDVPYGPDCFTVILDGFITSDNVDVTYVDIIDTGFTYSDHNPVELRFKLKK